MYFYLDIPFNTKEEAEAALGNIKLTYRGLKELGYVNQNNKQYREYILTSTDVPKLSNITNALDGSKAFVTDTQKTYYLSGETWHEC